MGNGIFDIEYLRRMYGTNGNFIVNMDIAKLESMTAISVLTLDEAEKMVLAFRALHPSIAEAGQRMRDLVEAMNRAEARVPRKPEKDKNLRISSKTGHSWPKAKGSY